MVYISTYYLLIFVFFLFPSRSLLFSSYILFSPRRWGLVRGTGGDGGDGGDDCGVGGVRW